MLHLNLAVRGTESLYHARHAHWATHSRPTNVAQHNSIKADGGKAIALAAADAASPLRSLSLAVLTMIPLTMITERITMLTLAAMRFSINSSTPSGQGDSRTQRLLPLHAPRR